MPAVAKPRGVYKLPDGQWTWYDPDSDTSGDAVPSRDEARTQYQDFRTSNKKNGDVSKVAGAIVPEPTEDQVRDDVEEEGERATPAKKAKASKPAKPAKTPKRGRTPGAVAKAWSIFDKQPKAKRKDVLALCVKAGINLNTAKTQYQRWLHREASK